MELTKLINDIKKEFNIIQIDELKDKLKEITLNNKYEYYEKFVNIVKDLKIDWLQKIYQYYDADRSEKKQDFTPKSLAKLVSRLSDNDEIVEDLCCGSGSLTIQKWSINNNLKFICKEIDENVIPFLLFNLAVRNIDAKVYRMDILENEIYEEYNVIKCEKFSKIVRIK